MIIIIKSRGCECLAVFVDQISFCDFEFELNSKKLEVLEIV